MRVPRLRRRARRAGGWSYRWRAGLLAVLVGTFLLVPAGAANAAPWDICSNSDPPAAQQAGVGVDSTIRPPADVPKGDTFYDQYGMSGMFWATIDLGCADMKEWVGNSLAQTVFDLAKLIDQTTITLYQAAYSDTLLSSLSGQVASVIHHLGDLLYFKYLTGFVVLGAIWAAWHGLVRRRATTTVEGTIWMVVAITVALWFFNRPEQILTAGSRAADTLGSAAVTAVGAAVPTNDVGGACLGAPDQPPSAVAPPPADAAGQRAHSKKMVSHSANTLWATLVCRPWVAGEFGTENGIADKKITIDGKQMTAAQALMQAQAFSEAEAAALSRQGGDAFTQAAQRKADQWNQVKNTVKDQAPSVYPLFQGKQPGTRLAIAFSALAAAVFAGALPVLTAIALIVLKIAFLLLLMVGPIFLLVGIHPGQGRIMALRWFEILAGTLLKQVVVALVMAILLLSYALVLDPRSPLPWVVQMLIVALIAAVFLIYRGAFRHMLALTSLQGTYSGSRIEQRERIRERQREVSSEHTRIREGGLAARLRGRLRPGVDPRLAGVAGASALLPQRWSEHATSGTRAGAVGEETAERVGADQTTGRGLRGEGGWGSVGKETRDAPPLRLGGRPSTPRGGGASWRTSAGTRSWSGSAAPERAGTSSGGGTRGSVPATPSGGGWLAGGGGRRAAPSAGGGSRGTQRDGSAPTPRAGWLSASRGGGSGGWFSGSGRSPAPSSNGKPERPAGWFDAARAGSGGPGGTPPAGRSHPAAPPATPSGGPGAGAPPQRTRDRLPRSGEAPSLPKRDGSREEGSSLPFWLRPVKRDE